MDRGIGKRPRADAIGPLHGAAGIQQTGRHDGRERRASLKRIDAVQSPPANGRLQHAVRIARKLLTAAKGQLIRPAQHEILADIEVRVSPVQV